jgi:hypothetical protein
VPDSKVPKATRSDPLYGIAKCQLYKIARTAEPGLYNTARRLIKPGLREAARRVPSRHNVASDSPDIRLHEAARSELAITKARPEPDFILPEAALCKAAKATRRVNALSPVGTEPAGQWDLYRDAVGLQTPTATV